jgi:hypothetical protein
VYFSNGFEIKSFLLLFFKKEALCLASMIEGHIETLTADGIVHGWVRDTESLSPCHVQVLFQGEKVAEAMAAMFRADLLRTGHGHGHYGFGARLRRPLPQGRCNVALHLPLHGRTAPMGLMVPPLAFRSAIAVEDLLAIPPSWTVDDLLAAPACLDAAGNYERLGTQRFVDALYRFVFDRWPSKAEARLHSENLVRGRLGPQDVLVDLLGSRERADLGPALPSPFDDTFPFTFG